MFFSIEVLIISSPLILSRGCVYDLSKLKLPDLDFKSRGPLGKADSANHPRSSQLWTKKWLLSLWLYTVYKNINTEYKYQYVNYTYKFDKKDTNKCKNIYIFWKIEKERKENRYHRDSRTTAYECIMYLRIIIVISLHYHAFKTKNYIFVIHF